jgi:uncharacterized membrane protein YphA (DoxX/SURF4 family)
VAFFIASGISRLISNNQLDQVVANMGLSIPPAVMLVIIGMELSGGLFLFLGYKMEFISVVLIFVTMLTTLLIQNQLLPVVKNGAVIAGLMLLMNNGGGETFLEYARTDIEDLPEYNTGL